MNKLFLSMIVALLALAANAQITPNRLIVHKPNYDYKAFAIGRVDSISFATVSGEVKANVEYKNYAKGDTGDTLWVSVKKSDACKSFKIATLPTNTANRYDDGVMASYFEQGNGAGPFYDDFSNGMMTGFETSFKANTSYTICTVGYDEYGVACDVSRSEFTTPKTPVVGNPTIDWTLDEATGTSLKLTFTPSSDVGGYAYCLFGKGEAEQQFQMWGPMMGFSNIGDMVKSFCQATITGTKTNTWTALNPGTDYEIYVQPWDVNGTYADMVICNVSTTKQGGEGVAQVTIEVKEFGGDSINGYYQRVLYTPNDQTSLFRDAIVDKAKINGGVWSEDSIVKYLKEDQPMNSHWNQYKADDAYWNAEPSTTYCAVAIAQNINGEWGPLAKVDFTTPDKVGSPTVNAAPAVARRIMKQKTAHKPAYAPALKVKGIKLVNSAE